MTSGPAYRHYKRTSDSSRPAAHTKNAVAARVQDGGRPSGGGRCAQVDAVLRAVLAVGGRRVGRRAGGGLAGVLHAVERPARALWNGWRRRDFRPARCDGSHC